MTANVDKAEQLSLYEQFYILLCSPETGKPRYHERKVARAMAMAILWEAQAAGVVKFLGPDVVEVDPNTDDPVTRRAAHTAAPLLPVTGHNLVIGVESALHPVWEAVADEMVHRHLLAEEARTRFVFFHQKVFTELMDARESGQELEAGLQQAVRNVWDPSYEDQLARTHPKLVARLIILDNFGLLEPLLGHSLYAQAAPHVAELKQHFVEALASAPVEPERMRQQSGIGADYSDHTYYGDSGCTWWTDNSWSGYSDHGGGFLDFGGGDSSSDSGGGDSGGGDGGGCGGCGGCGG